MNGDARSLRSYGDPTALVRSPRRVRSDRASRELPSANVAARVGSVERGDGTQLLVDVLHLVDGHVPDLLRRAHLLDELHELRRRSQEACGRTSTARQTW